MAQQEINIGVEGNDGTGDSIRESFRKTNENFSEIYAIFGQGGAISLTALSDTPDTYAEHRGKLLAVNQTENGVEVLELVSGSEKTGDELDNTVVFDYSVPGKVILTTQNTKVNADRFPQLSGPLNANSHSIAGVTVSEAAAALQASIYGTGVTVDDLVIDKKYADQSYLARSAPGRSANVRSEPETVDEYTLTVDAAAGSAVTIENHGLTQSSNGAAYVYHSDTPAANLSNGSTYYLRVVDANTVQLHTSADDAEDNTDAIDVGAVSGTHTLTDGAYNSELMGNWLSNEALPRNSVVRRQGDAMEGALYLSDHPGDLAGVVTSTEDLQAATKFYVDNTAYTSTTVLYVNPQGDDAQPNVPAGKEGRSSRYAYRSIAAAARKAEEISLLSALTLGPYAQPITTNNGVLTTVTSAGFATASDSENYARIALLADASTIQAELAAEYTIVSSALASNINQVIQSIAADIVTGENANYLSRQAAFDLFRIAELRKLVTAKQSDLLLVFAALRNKLNLLLAGTANVTETTRNSVLAKVDVVTGIIQSGVFDAVPVVDGKLYRVLVNNANSNSVDQGTTTNNDILPGKLIKGTTSGALGKIVKYTPEFLDLSNPDNTDIIEVVLLSTVEFEDGEQLLLASAAQRDQIMIHVEAGTYAEHFPIRVPPNTSVIGAAVDRTVVGPIDAPSESPWASIEFYRDSEFDQLTGLSTSGVAFVDPRTNTVAGYFGYHYLTDAADSASAARSSVDIDAFMLSSGSAVESLTVQKYKGFAAVLDPTAQSLQLPRVHNFKTIAYSNNQQAFRGGIYIDAYTGNTPVEVYSKTDAFTLKVRGAVNSKLFRQLFEVPAPFYIDGKRFQVNSVRNWDPLFGTAELLLDRTSNSGTGFTGVTSSLPSGVDLSNPTTSNPISIVVQTAGSRAITVADCEMLNDLSYGVVANNGGVCVVDNVDTHYCWAGLLANNGSEIRSVGSSTYHGEYGVVAIGSSPNEIPDEVQLAASTVQPARVFSADIALTFASAVTVTAGDTLVQGSASGVAVFSGTNKTVYLVNVSGVFANAADITVNSESLGTPTAVVSLAYQNDAAQQSLFVYDLATPLQNRGAVDVYHPGINKFAKYSVTNATPVADVYVDRYEPPFTGDSSGVDAVFVVSKTHSGYSVSVKTSGSGYLTNQVFTVQGADLGGASPANNLTITVTAVAGGAITAVSTSGTPSVTSTTPTYNGAVYQLNFSTSSLGYETNGLLEPVAQRTAVTVRQTQSFIFDDVTELSNSDLRTSPAVVFKDDPSVIYRSVSVNNTDAYGNILADAEKLVTLDTEFRFLELTVAQAASASSASIVVEPVAAARDIELLSSGSAVFSWSGKLHRITGYNTSTRDVTFADVANADLNQPQATGLAATLPQGATVACGVGADALAEITVDVSVCSAIGHNFINVGTGGANTTNYPDVLYGAGREPSQSNEIIEQSRGKVYFVSTDQSGVFRAGNSFAVDQNTGAVTFSANIALSNLDGIGFSRGVVVNEFSNDDTLSSNSPEIVPVQSAIRSYIDRRLGFDQEGNFLTNIIGSGALTAAGTVPLTNDLNAAGNTIINLKSPDNASDAANKGYVDQIAVGNSRAASLQNLSLAGTAPAQPLVLSGRIVAALPETITGPGLVPNTTFTTLPGNATGTINATFTKKSPTNVDWLMIAYTPGDGTVTAGTTITTSNGTTITVAADSDDEIVNGVATGDSDIALTVARAETNPLVTLLNHAIKPGAVLNTHINSAAGIAQSKLSMSRASTIGPVSKNNPSWTPSAATQADLGLSAFDEAVFSVNNGVVTINTTADTVLGRTTGTGVVSPQAVTTTGASNAIVKTQADGSVMARSLKLGSSSDYTVMTVSGTELAVRTPGQATVLTASGTSNSTLSVNFPGSVTVGNGINSNQSVLQGASLLANQNRLAVNWLHTSFVEAPGEKGAGSTGVAIGASNGKTTAGQVGIVAASGTTASVMPAIFSSTGVVPDVSNTYNIGSSTRLYKDAYIKTLNAGTSSSTGSVVGVWGAAAGSSLNATKLATARTIALSGDVTGSVSFDGSANVTISATVIDDSHNHIISNVDGLQSALNSKQPTLVSGTNIKTIGGVSLVGGGDVPVRSEHYSQETTPLTPALGATWYVPSTSSTYLRVNDGVNNIWVDIGGVPVS